MHRDPTHHWTVTELADAVHLARSTFAARFKDLVGVPPLDYLLQWRMHRAGALLRHRDVTVTAVAEAVGYSSHSSFSTAFKRVMGAAPTHYQRAKD